MPVILGSTPDAGFDEPLRLLADCHRRIEMFLDVLARLAETAESMLLPDARRALERALTYFAEAAPRHTQDEEHSLFPRMRERGGPELAAALAEVDRLESDHQCAEAMHKEVELLGRNWLRHGELDASSAAKLRDNLSRLRALYASHIDAEERVVFTAAARVLNDSSLREIGREMADRRGVRWMDESARGPATGRDSSGRASAGS